MSKSIFWQGYLKLKKFALKIPCETLKVICSSFFHINKNFAFKLIKSSQDSGRPSFCHPPLHNRKWEREESNVLGNTVSQPLYWSSSCDLIMTTLWRVNHIIDKIKRVLNQNSLCREKSKLILPYRNLFLYLFLVSWESQ